MKQQRALNSVRLIGRVSLWFSLVSLVGLAVVVMLADLPESDYLGRAQALALTRERLPLVMLIGGLILAIGTGITTWLITLYSSFRIAGPLYRFSRNLETGIHTGKVPAINIRGSDHLQAESDLLQRAVGTLYDHYRGIDALAVDALSAKQNQDLEALERALMELKALKGCVRYEKVKSEA